MGKSFARLSTAEKQVVRERKAKKALEKKTKADLRKVASSKAAQSSKAALAGIGASPSKVKDKESRVTGHTLFEEINESLQTWAGYHKLGSSDCDNSYMFKALAVFEKRALLAFP